MLENLKPAPVIQRCKVGRFLEGLELTDQKLLQGYLDDLDFSAEALSAALKGRVQSDVGPTVIRNHRKNQCPCAKLS